MILLIKHGIPKDDGVYVTGNYKINGKTHQFQSNGKWIAELSGTPAFEKGKYTKVIFLDPGHGGRDSGAFYYNIAEKDLNMQIYKKLRKELEGLGYTVLTSRESDVYVDFVTERSKMVNKTNADMFISIHFNASGSPASNRSGIQTYLTKKIQAIALRLIHTGITILIVSVKVIALLLISTLLF